MTNLIAAKNHACTAWYRYTDQRNIKTRVARWTQDNAPDGTPRIACEVTGPSALQEMHRFVNSGLLLLGRDGDVSPSLDYRDGRVSCTWRHLGVWVELWVPDTQPAAPKPVAAPQKPVTPGVDAKRLIRPSGRLPFGRLRLTDRKETRA